MIKMTWNLELAMVTFMATYVFFDEVHLDFNSYIRWYMHISSNDENFGYRSTLMDGAMVKQWWNAQCNEVNIWLFMSWMTSPTACLKSLPTSCLTSLSTLLTTSWMKFMHDYLLFIHMDDIHSMFIHNVIKKAL